MSVYGWIIASCSSLVLPAEASHIIWQSALTFHPEIIADLCDFTESGVKDIMVAFCSIEGYDHLSEDICVELYVLSTLFSS